MLHHLLFVATPEQIELTQIALKRLRAVPLEENRFGPAYQISHRLIHPLTLNVQLMSNINAITPYLRHGPVDLLIYDERNGNTPVKQALHKIREDVEVLTENWGPDFQFPMSRVVAIIEHADNEAATAFELGRVNVRDVFVAPKNTASILRWVHKTLVHGVAREERIGMACGGGGLEGFLYQLGVCQALNDAVIGKDLTSIYSYAGVSSGAIASALLAGKVPPLEVIKAAHGKSEVLPSLNGSLLFDFAASSISKRVIKQSMSWAGTDPQKWLNKFLRSIPTGIFKGEELREYFEKSILAYGSKDSFENPTAPNLYIGATDQDRFEHITFGTPGWKDIKISEALRASCALPPFFTPTKIKDRWFIDGQVTRSCNLELLVQDHCRLIFIIDPMKPYSYFQPGSVDEMGGVFSIIQTIKALVHTRFQNTLKHLAERYPDVDFLVFQPDEECAAAMAGVPMRYKIRTEIITLAYRQTLRQLRARHNIYHAKMQRYGLILKSPDELVEFENHPPEPINAHDKPIRGKLL